jgi:serine/threonine-protein kinase
VGNEAAPDPREVADLFDAALERPSAERAELLDRACGGRPALRAEVEALLEANDRAGGFLDSPAPSLLALDMEEEDEPRDGDRIGPYRVVREIGRGGMGAVYLAERADGAFEQQVALKLIRKSIVSQSLIRRFLRERQILARLEHPSIARLLDGGMSEDGQPYFAMELVRGTPLTTYCDARKLPLAARLSLFEQACGAVRHAHANLVVHRDLKPSNMLVTEEGALKLLDFGIARVLSEEAGADAGLTRGGLAPLTPEYAAPEQLRGQAATTSTDVYALGVVLHELLTGARPGSTGEPQPLAEAVSRPRGAADAVSPTEIAGARGTTPKRLKRLVAGDLEAIVHEALQADPAQRYPSVEALAGDLARFRDGLPVRARPATLRYRTGKLLRRHRVGSAAAAAAVLSLLVGLTASLWQAQVAARERDRAEAAAAEAEEVAAYLVDLFRNVDPEHGAGAATTARELLDRGAARLGTQLGDRPRTRARLLEAIASVYRHLRLLEPAEDLLEEAVATREREQGATHPDLVQPLVDLAAIRYRRIRYREAEATLKRALSIADASGLDETEAYASGLVLLGNLHLAERSWAEAEATYRRALTVLERSGNAAGRDEAAILNNLGVALEGQGRLADAEAVHRQALSMREAARGAGHFSVAQSLVNLARVVLARGALDEAAPLAERAHAIRLATYGPAHTAVAETLSLRADVLVGQGRLAEAEADQREALRIREAGMGPLHPESAMSAIRLAFVLAKEGKREEAGALAEKALATLAGAEGPSPEDVARARSLVAELRGGAGASPAVK